ncbi:hypothetical protein Moror_12895 [Moniliophthora roreri MCA 2997]|uniref:Uncharacterized protein n=1 Tax=Moniliophthora roreri (strain MCA 2997) TaxID=1381753 RepID=V2XMA9_MONRO|nr:hypothetical protein Moror_12895 [Moniliophthora roreri MCA 2997]
MNLPPVTFESRHKHGPYMLSMDNVDDVARLEMNTPLRNLVRTYAYGLETLQSKGAIQHMRVTGGDYAGFYQEAFLMAPMYRLSSIGLTASPSHPCDILLAAHP